MAKKVMVRTSEDLDRAGRALASHFSADIVVVIGSQSVLVGWPDAPIIMRTSGEIDAYPANYREWEEMPENEGIPASEEINALFGFMSDFDETHGFYIDGCDDTTARLPPDWQKRAVYKTIYAYGSKVELIAPCIEDMTLSKLIRLVEKDRGWITSLHASRPLNKALLLERMRAENLEQSIIGNAQAFLQTLPDLPPQKNPVPSRVPDFPKNTHCAFFTPSTNMVSIRKWDPRTRVYNMIDNPLGPAVVEGRNDYFFIDGRKTTEEEWRERRSPSQGMPDESGSRNRDPESKPQFKP